jgi:hypothetical protein
MTETTHQLHRDDETKRQNGMNKPARDPGDEAKSPTPKKVSKPEKEDPRSSNPVIDFDGLIRPGKSMLPPPHSCTTVI